MALPPCLGQREEKFGMGMAGSLGHSSRVGSASGSFDPWILLSFYFIFIVDLFIYCIYIVCLGF